MFSLSSGSLSTKFLSCPFLLDAIFMPQNEPMKIQEWFSMHSAHGHSSHEIKGRYRAYKHYCLHEEKNVLQSCNNWVAKNVNFCLLVRTTDFLASWFLTFAIPLSGGKKIACQVLKCWSPADHDQSTAQNIRAVPTKSEQMAGVGFKWECTSLWFCCYALAREANNQTQQPIEWWNIHCDVLIGCSALAWEANNKTQQPLEWNIHCDILIGCSALAREANNKTQQPLCEMVKYSLWCSDLAETARLAAGNPLLQVSL